jgi:hypothetical protein
VVVEGFAVPWLGLWVPDPLVLELLLPLLLWELPEPAVVLLVEPGLVPDTTGAGVATLVEPVREASKPNRRTTTDRVLRAQ